MRRIAEGKDDVARVVLRVPPGSEERHAEAMCHATVVEHDAEADLALLKFDDPLPDQLAPVVLMADETPRRDWHTTAWPEQFDGVTDGTDFEGRVIGMTSSGAQPVLTLFEPSSAAVAPLDLHGASGAPVLIDCGGAEVAVGMLRRILPDEEHPERAVGGRTFAIPARQILKRWGERIERKNPFKPPLHPFEVTDGDSFFGREAPVESLRAAVRRRRTRVVTLMGASGTGKSSLVRAGLLGQDDQWSNSSAPARTDGCVIAAYDAACLDALRRFGERSATASTLIVLDQLEQLLFEAPEQVMALGERMSSLMESKPDMTVILVIRTDYMPLFEKPFPSWFRFIEDGLTAGSEIHLEVTREQLFEMCHRPAAAAGLTFEPGLVGTIVNALLDAHPPIGRTDAVMAPPTVLPLLGITLWRLAEEPDPSGVISLRQYERMGGIGGALTDWADQAFRSAQGRIGPGAQVLVAEQPAVSGRPLRQVLLRLVRIGQGELTPATREFVPRDELRTLTDPSDAAERAIRSLEDAGLIFSGSDGEGQRSGAVALRHDALITEWPMLRDLVRAATKTLRWKVRNFDANYEVWRSSNGAAGQLRAEVLSAAEAQERENPDAFSDGERIYITEQRRRARREAQAHTARRIGIPVGVLIVVALVAVLATLRTRQSDTSARNAVQAAGSLETAAKDAETHDPALAQALLLEAYRQRPADENGRSALAEAVSIGPGLVATGSDIGSTTVMPDFSGVIAPPSGGRCASVQALSDSALPRSEYCGGGSPGELAASPGSRVVAELSQGHSSSEDLTEWRRDTMQPRWSEAVDRAPGGPGRYASLAAVAVADDGTAAALDGRGLHLYTEAGRPISLGRAGSRVRGISVKISANGRTVLTVDNIRSASVEPTTRATTFLRIGGRFEPGPSWSVRSFANPVVSPDGRFIVEADDAGLQRLDTATGKIDTVRSVPSQLARASLALALSPSGRLLALSQTTADVAEVDLRTGGERLIPVAPSNSGTDNLAVDEAGDLVLGGFGGWAYYRTRTSGEVLSKVPLTDSDISAGRTSLSSDGALAAVTAPGSSSQQTTVEIFDLRTGVRRARLPSVELAGLTWQPSDTLLITERNGHVLAVPRSGRQRLIAALPTRSRVVMDATGRFAAWSSGPGAASITIYDVRAGRSVRTITVNVPVASSIAIAPSATRVSVIGPTRTAVITAPLSPHPQVNYVQSGPSETGGAPPPPPVSSALLAPAVSPDGTVIAFASSQSNISVRSVDSSTTHTITLPGSEYIQDIAVSDTELAVLDGSGDVRIFTFNGAESVDLAPPPATNTTAQAAPNSIAFSPTGTQLAMLWQNALSVLTLRPATWAAAICERHPTLSSSDYQQYAQVGTLQPLCQ